jgi:MinD superfamily P-loop ATPase
MRELAIVSGKGGTGKTSLMGSFAAIAGKAILVDCDVDAADLHLIVNHKILEEHDFSSSSRASIIEETCLLCGICAEKCRFDSIIHQYKSSGECYQVDPLACEGCGLCKQVCPCDAIAFESVISGKWFRSDSEYGPFFHAKLGIAEANSGKLVSTLRQQALGLSKRADLDMIIIDGPPGIGCPVIASITGTSYILIVTEPSLSAIHDMKRIFALAEHFDIKAGMCINKFDINLELSRQIEKFAADNDIPVHGRIPFDPMFIEAQIKGVPYIKVASPERAQIVKNIWDNVNNQICLIENELLKKESA